MSYLAVRINTMITLLLNKDLPHWVVCSGGHRAITVARTEFFFVKGPQTSCCRKTLGDLVLRSTTPSS